MVIMRRAMVAVGLVATLTGCGQTEGGSASSPSTAAAEAPSTTTGGQTAATAIASTVTTGGASSTPTSSDGPDIAFACSIPKDEGQALGMCTLDRGKGQVVVLGSTLGPSVAPAWNPIRATYPLAYVCRYRRTSAHDLWPTGEGADLGLRGFARNQGGEICIVDRKQTVNQVTSTGQRANAPTWSPDGTRLAFAMSAGPVIVAGGTTTPATDLGPGLYLITSQAMNRITSGTADDFPDWSPDGARLAFSSEQGIAVANADGSDRRQLTSGSWVDLGPQWSPDGSRIAFTRYVQGGAPAREVWVMRADGADARMMVRFGGGFDPSVAYDSTPAWSPDGKRLAVSGAYGDDSPTLSVLVIDVSSAAVTEVSPPDPTDVLGSIQPSWSPDGLDLLFVEMHDDGSTRLMYVHPDGSAPRPVPGVAMPVFDPAWG